MKQKEAKAAVDIQRYILILLTLAMDSRFTSLIGSSS